MRTCAVADCDRRHEARGFCTLHYRRFTQTGTTEPRPHPTLGQRLWSRVVWGEDNCWNWTAGKSEGYGQIVDGSRADRVHRVVYKRLVGPIPDGLEIDHLCRNRACCNPQHLEPVTKRENLRRGMSAAATRLWHAAKTHCPNGHAYDAANSLPPGEVRRCRACKQASLARKRAARRERTIFVGPWPPRVVPDEEEAS